MKKLLSNFSEANRISLSILSVLFLILISSAIQAQTEQKYSEVRIFASSDLDFRKMMDAGLFIDHAIRKPGKYLDAWLSEYEIALLKKSGVPYEILVEDWHEYYENLPKMNQQEKQEQMRSANEKDNVSHSIYGSMGGFLKYSEVVAKLDSMRLEYPQFISQKINIGNTFQGRPMWVVRVTKNPDAPTGRPEVFYNALIHAREPESMETQVYYFYWLFENYGIDPVATYILDHREIYWLPVFNADGYVYNETTNPNGGGMWRCNRRGSGDCGWVDLNRNFGIFEYWNSPNGGSSEDSCSGGSSTYRGRSPFSEIETRNLMNFVNSRNFQTTFNAHTFGNIFIKPWAWIDPTPTPDDNKFNQFLLDMGESSSYVTGSVSQTLGYFVRGGADDWFYNDSSHSNHHIFAMTPETGNTGFWPAENEIVPFAQNMLYSNQYLSLVAGQFVNPVSKKFDNPTYNPGESGIFKVVFKNKGLLPAANVKIILTPVSIGLTIPVNQQTFPAMASFATDSSEFDFTIDGNVLVNTALRAELKIVMDTTEFYSQPIYVLVGQGDISLNDNAEGSFSNWVTNQGWGLTTLQSHSPTHSFTDSPLGNYQDEANNSMTTANEISVDSSAVVQISFYHKYFIEPYYDFGYVEVSKNNDNIWQKLKSYTDTLSTWTLQSFDLSPYISGASNIKIRFRLYSDEIITEDGWYVDDIKIIKYRAGPVGLSSNTEIVNSFSLEQNYPNPFNPVTVIRYTVSSNSKSNVKLTVYDILGSEVAALVNEKQNTGSYEIKFDGSNLSSGVYYYKLESGDLTITKKMLLIK